MTIIAIEELKSLCHDLLTSYHVRGNDAELIVEHLVENECSGKASHGMVRMPEVIKTIQKLGVPTDNPLLEIDNDNIAVWDANGQIGVVAGKTLMIDAIERAKAYGLAMVGVKNYIATCGSMAFYLRRIAQEGLIAIMGCNSIAAVTTPGGKKPLIGTNPIGIAIPGQNEDELIADLATSAIAYGKIMVLRDLGEEIPEGVLIDKDGNLSSDGHDADEGAILPLANYKGFSLGLMVELLAGPLIGGKALKEGFYDGDGLFIIAIDPVKFGNANFYQQISDALFEVKNSPLRPGHDEITLPGERSARKLNVITRNGEVDVAEKTLNDIHRLTEEQNNAA